MSEEYKMLREEVMNSIAKQDTLSNIIFTVLGASSIYVMNNSNADFAILALAISAVLLAWMLHYKHVVLYTSTYLHYLEESGEKVVNWEHKRQNFEKKLKKETGCNFFVNILLKLIYGARVYKYLGNFILASYLFMPLAYEIYRTYDMNFICALSDMNILLGVIFYLLNLLFTIAVCSTSTVQEVYRKTWCRVFDCQADCKGCCMK